MSESNLESHFLNCVWEIIGAGKLKFRVGLHFVITMIMLTDPLPWSHLHVEPSHKVLCKSIFGKCSETWLSCGSYGIYVAITGPLWLLQGAHGSLSVDGPCRPQNCHVNQNMFYMSSIKSQKGIMNTQRCSVENQKGVINTQRCSIENQKGAITVQCL